MAAPTGEHRDVRSNAEAVAAAMPLLRQNDRPMAGCQRDSEPLVSTMEFRGAEFYCQVCGATYGFLSPKPLTWTAERQERHDELKAAYDIERAHRDPVIQMVYAIHFIDQCLGQDHRKILVSR